MMDILTVNKTAMEDQVRNGNGFIAALDQSGGSTPKALKAYGVEETAYDNDEEMFDLIHGMRTRIVNAPAFTGAKIVGAILFEMTFDRKIGGKPSAQYLWEDRRVVPFLKIDKGLEAEANGCQMLKPMPGLDDLLTRAAAGGVFGTKERSVISAANAKGIEDIVRQQFDVGRQVIRHGLVPMLLPEEPNIYQPLVDHPNVMRVVALSGGYSRDEANARLSQNTGVIASFSRALTEGLNAQQDDDAFNALLSTTIEEIFAASVAG